VTSSAPAPRKGPHLARAFASLLAIISVTLILLSGIVRCPVAFVLHIPCPGCGTVRSARALCMFDLAGAFRANPVAPFILALVFIMAVRFVVLMALDGHARELAKGAFGRVLGRAFIVLAVAEILVWGLRFFGLFGGPVSV
jgi:hypothetical protein